VEHRRFLAVWQALIVLILGLGIAHAGTECSEGTSMTTNETLTLEPKAIVAFLDRFLDKGFDLERAKAIFGKVKISTNPDLLVLEGVTPPGAEEVDALLVKGTLMELFITLERPVAFDADALSGLLGPPRTLPRLHPGQPVPQLYERKGRDFDGNVQIGLVSEGAGASRLKSIRFVRLLPS
jgi:hypothetical protein